MRLAFIDIAVAYNASRPDTGEALGGTTSAVCFLARELVKAGAACTLFNKIREPVTEHGVRSLPLENLIDECHKGGYDALIFCGRWIEPMVNLVRASTRAPLIAWMHESAFEPQLVPALPAFDAIAFVSEWQKRINQPFVHAHWKQAVMRNAMNPRAAEIFAPGESILPAKTQPPILLYAGATPRGAFHIPPLLDRLRPLQNDFTMEIYCDCNASRDAIANAEYLKWMRGLPNVTHVGAMGQTDLLQRMKRASFFVSPNPWPETSCIALIEALTAGLSVITTDRAVLPETAAGFAKHVPIEDTDEPIRFDMAMPYDIFAQTVSDAMNEWKSDPAATETRLRKQTLYFHDHYRWPQRVLPWMEFIHSLENEAESGA